jgi:hypothetical protein
METTFTYAPITNSKVIGKGADGVALRSWDEGDRSFIETYAYTKTASGISYGCVRVVEVTPA